MISSEGEMMEYRRGIPAEGKVEDWMTGVLQEMRATNRLITKEAIFNYRKEGQDRWVGHGQVGRSLYRPWVGPGQVGGAWAGSERTMAGPGQVGA